MNHALAVSALIGSILDNNHAACLKMVCGHVEQNFNGWRRSSDSIYGTSLLDSENPCFVQQIERQEY